MRYGRVAHGHPWHMLVKATKPMCFDAMTITETRDTPPEDGFVCKNCDEQLRLKGKEVRKKLPRKQSKTEYTPRYRFEDM